jgi:hypothetical protein
MRSPANVWQLALLTLKDGLRRKTLLALFGLALLFISANIFVAELFTWDLAKVSVEFGLSTVALTGLLLIFFTATKSLADDLEHHKIYFIMARPVSPWQYILGKFWGLGLLLLLVVLILGAAAAVSLQYVIWRYPAFTPPSFSWAVYLLALCLQWFSLLTMLAVTFFWFNFASHSFVAIMLSAGTYLVGQNMELLRQIAREAGEDGPSLQRGIIVAISWLLPNLSIFDWKATAAYGLDFDGRQLLFILGYGLGYAALLLFAAKFFFGRKELL